jgi:hypothetical protein
MARLEASRRLANECQKNQPVNLSGAILPAAIEVNDLISGAVCVHGQGARIAQATGTTVISSLTLKGPNATVFIGEVVRIAGDWAKVMFHSLLIPRPTRYVNGYIAGVC